MNRLAVLLLMTLSTPSAFASTFCEGSKESCDYYLCREKENPCGSKGYFLGFGYRYCKSSEGEFADSMSEAGKVWLKRVAQCLREKTELVPIETECGDVRKAVVSDHADCYLQTGYCALPTLDQLRVIGLIGREIRDHRVLEQGLEILSRCGTQN